MYSVGVCGRATCSLQGTTKQAIVFCMASLAADSSSSSSDSEDEEQGEVVEIGCFTVPSSALSAALSQIEEEELVRKSSKGPQIAVLVEAIMANMSAGEVATFSTETIKQIQSWLKPNKAGKVVVSRLWRNFHLFRLSPSTRSMWQACTSSLHLSEDVLKLSDMTLQLVLKRMMKSIVQQLTVPSGTCSPPTEASLSLRECNILRYIAGYIVFKMKKKFPLHSQSFDNFVVTSFNYINVSTIDEYSRMWVEQVDRGGLYNVSEGFYCLLREFESVSRLYLDVTRANPPEKLYDVISKDLLSSPAVTTLWSQLSTSFESNSCYILKALIKLWLNICVHSFAHDWSDVLCGKAEKALRKSLQQKTNEKKLMLAS